MEVVKIKQWKYILLIGVFVILTLVGYWLLPKENEVQLLPERQETEPIFVHITGEIKNPGLVEVKYGTRVYELIELAGGETENADLTRVNLASIVSDEQKIVIPAKVIFSEEAAEEKGGIVNINTASKERLMQLSGIGEGTAEKIIRYRQENGYFNTPEDLMNVSGIGQSKYNGIKDQISI